MTVIAGCGKDKQEAVPETEEETMEVIIPTYVDESVLDEILAEEEGTEVSTEVDTGGPAERYRADVQIAGQDVSVGWTTLQMLKEKGFQLVGDVDVNEVIYEGSTVETQMTAPGGGDITFYLQPPIDMPTIRDGCRVSGFRIKSGKVSYDLLNGMSSTVTVDDMGSIEGFSQNEDGSWESPFHNAFDVENGSLTVTFDEEGALADTDYKVWSINF